MASSVNCRICEGKILLPKLKVHSELCFNREKCREELYSTEQKIKHCLSKEAFNFSLLGPQLPTERKGSANSVSSENSKNMGFESPKFNRLKPIEPSFGSENKDTMNESASHRVKQTYKMFCDHRYDLMRQNSKFKTVKVLAFKTEGNEEDEDEDDDIISDNCETSYFSFFKAEESNQSEFDGPRYKMPELSLSIQQEEYAVKNDEPNFLVRKSIFSQHLREDSENVSSNYNHSSNKKKSLFKRQSKFDDNNDVSKAINEEEGEEPLVCVGDMFAAFDTPASPMVNQNFSNMLEQSKNSPGRYAFTGIKPKITTVTTNYSNSNKKVTKASVFDNMRKSQTQYHKQAAKNSQFQTLQASLLRMFKW
jgi:hypothetical protein